MHYKSYIFEKELK